MALFKVKKSQNKSSPVVFIHGGPGANSGLFLGATLRHASTDFQERLVLHDQPGCGFDTSLVEVFSFESLCTHLEEDLQPYSKIHLLAESFGCTLALEFAQRNSDKVQSLTLIGPHLNRHQAQKNIYERATFHALALVGDLAGKSPEQEHLKNFLQARKCKILYRESSSKKRSIAKDLFLSKWSEQQKYFFELELSRALIDDTISPDLKNLLLEIFLEDLTVFKSGAAEKISTETLKGFAKRYDLFFKHPEETFTEVTKCRETAITLSNSPYTAELLDRSNKRFSRDLETRTDWETQNRWFLVDQLLQEDLDINVITGSEDPFATDNMWASAFKKSKNYKSYVLAQASHSPIYESSKITFQILESIYGK